MSSVIVTPVSFLPYHPRGKLSGVPSEIMPLCVPATYS